MAMLVRSKPSSASVSLDARFRFAVEPSFTVKLSGAATGTVDYTHDGSETVADSFTYTIDDLSGVTSNTETVNLTVAPVNDAPVAGADSFAVNEGATGNMNLAANDTDVDDGLDLSRLSIVTGPAYGAIAVNADGTIDYTHDGSETVADSFTYTIDDLSGTPSNLATVNLTVNPVNDAPVAANTSINADENTAYTGTLPAASDAEGDTVTYALNTTAANGSAVVSSNGTFSYTPNTGWTGADSFTYTVDDGNGGINTHVVSVNVASNSSPPPVGGGGTTPPGPEPGGGDPDPGTDPDPTEEEPPAEDEPEPLVEEEPPVTDSGGTDDPLVELIPTGEDGVQDIIYLTDNDNKGYDSGERRTKGEIVYFDNDLYKDMSALQYLKLGSPDPDYRPVSSSEYDFSKIDFDSSDAHPAKAYQDYDLLKNQIEESYENDQANQAIRARIITVTAASITAGFVSYLLRAGSLIASLVSTLPVWRGFDPIAVLVGKKKKRKDDKAKTDEDQQNADAFFDGEAE